MNVDAMVKELIVQENDMEMYINMGKNYLTTLYPKQIPPETDSKTKIQKTQPCIHKKPKISRKHEQKNTKKILELKKLYQMSSPSNVNSKKKKTKCCKKN